MLFRADGEISLHRQGAILKNQSILTA